MAQFENEVGYLAFFSAILSVLRGKSFHAKIAKKYAEVAKKSPPLTVVERRLRKCDRRFKLSHYLRITDVGSAIDRIDSNGVIPKIPRFLQRVEGSHIERSSSAGDSFDFISGQALRSG